MGVVRLGACPGYYLGYTGYWEDEGGVNFKRTVTRGADENL